MAGGGADSPADSLPDREEERLRLPDRDRDRLLLLADRGDDDRDLDLDRDETEREAAERGDLLGDLDRDELLDLEGDREGPDPAAAGDPDLDRDLEDDEDLDEERDLRRERRMLLDVERSNFEGNLASHFLCTFWKLAVSALCLLPRN